MHVHRPTDRPMVGLNIVCFFFVKLVHIPQCDVHNIPPSQSLSLSLSLSMITSLIMCINKTVSTTTQCLLSSSLKS